MSNLNTNWLKDNFSDTDVVIFNIGCALLADESRKIKELLPRADIYSFDCSPHWKSRNLEDSKLYNLKYFHVAVSDSTQEQQLYSSYIDNQAWGYSDTVIPPDQRTLVLDQATWKPTEIVTSTTLADFCHEHKIKPDILLLDTEGSDYKILSTLEHTIAPNVIWVRIGDPGISLTFTDFDHMMNQKEFKLVFRSNGNNCLYVHKDCLYTEYIGSNNAEGP